VLAVLQEKDVIGICTALGPIARRWLLPSIRSERALSPRELRLTIQDQVPDVPVAIVRSFAAAWEKRGGRQFRFSSPVHCISRAKRLPSSRVSRQRLKSVSNEGCALATSD
jgi:hypothetical protein